MGTTSRSASTWSPTSTSSCPPRLSKPPVFAPTSTSSRAEERNLSISVSASTPTTSSVSTRCCRALVPIDCRRVCVVLSASPTVLSLVSTSVRSLCPSVLGTLTALLPRGSEALPVQVPWSPKDHRLQELGFHSPQARRVRPAAPGGQGQDRRCLRPVPPQQG